MAIRRALNRVYLYGRAYRGRIALSIIALIAIQAVLLYVGVRSTNEVSDEEVLAEFRRRQRAADTELKVSPSPSFSDSSIVAPTASPIHRATSVQSSSSPCPGYCPETVEAPKAGKYTWFQCGKTSGQCSGAPGEPLGSENLGGVRREFPQVGKRFVVRTGPASWNNVHLYSDKHREEFDLHADTSGVYDTSYIVDIEVTAGYHEKNAISQDPHLQLLKFPLYEGLSWGGKWTDRNRHSDGEYKCRVTGRQVILVGGQRVDTWVIQADLKLLGPKNTGDVRLTLWASPEHQQTVQELYDEQIRNERNILYTGAWMVTLKDLVPET